MFRAFAGAAALFAAVSSPVHAGPIIDVVDPGPDIYLSSDIGQTSSFTFVHDLTDNGFQPGDIISSASITISLAELVIRGAGSNPETYRYSFDLGAQTYECVNGNCVPDPGVLDTISLVAGLPNLADDGKISVTVSALSGGFYFADSTLTAEVVPGIRPNPDVTASVPVPSTLLLLGAGLMGLGLRPLRRRA